MAFCKNCGRELQDGELCNCNDTFGEVTTTKKKFNVKFLAVGVAAVLIVAVVIMFSSLGGGYKKPVKDLIDSMNKGNAEKMFYAIAPEKKIKEMKKEMKDSKFDWDDLVELMEKGLESGMESLEEQYGKNVKFDVKFLDKKKIKGDDLDEIEELYDDEFDAEITKAYKVKTEITIKGKKDKDSNTNWLYVVKVKGDDWKVSTYDDESGITDMFDLSF